MLANWGDPPLESIVQTTDWAPRSRSQLVTFSLRVPSPRSRAPSRDQSPDGGGIRPLDVGRQNTHAKRFVTPLRDLIVAQEILQAVEHP